MGRRPPHLTAERPPQHDEHQYRHDAGEQKADHGPAKIARSRQQTLHIHPAYSTPRQPDSYVTGAYNPVTTRREGPPCRS